MVSRAARDAEAEGGSSASNSAPVPGSPPDPANPDLGPPGPDPDPPPPGDPGGAQAGGGAPEPAYRRCLTDAELRNAKKVLLGKKALMASDSALAELLGVTELKLDLARKAFTEAVIDGKVDLIRDLADASKVAKQWKGILPLLAAKVRYWDETTFTLGVHEDADSGSIQRPWSIMQSVFFFLVLIQCPAANEQVKHLMITGHVPSPLLALQQQTGDLMNEGLLRASSVVDLDALFSHFIAKQQLGCADRAGANSSVSTHDTLTRCGWGELLLGCQVHDSHHCLTETLLLRSRLVPRVASALASIASGGLLTALRQCLIEHIENGGVDRRIEGGGNTAEAEAHRQSCLNAGWPWPKHDGYHGKKRTRRVVMERLPNGDWRVRNGKIVHWCRGRRCCRNYEHCVSQFVTYFVPAVLPYNPVSISQHR
jgi:hypothetical protein